MSKMSCKDCGAEMKPLFTGVFCSAECDRRPTTLVQDEKIPKIVMFPHRLSVGTLLKPSYSSYRVFTLQRLEDEDIESLLSTSVSFAWRTMENFKDSEAPEIQQTPVSLFNLEFCKRIMRGDRDVLILFKEFS